MNENLSDSEILELNALCNALVDGTLTETQRTRLNHLLATSEAARRFYVRALGLSASLYHYASEMQVEPAEKPAPARARFRLRPSFWTWFAPVAAAAGVALFLGLGGWRKSPQPAEDSLPRPYVARLTGSKDCRWADTSAVVHPGEYIWQGQQLNLGSGFAEITFDSGARVVLEGPTSLRVNSAWDATLHWGVVKVTAPSQAVGFRISNPAVEVVDIGTEFAMISEPDGATDVLVLKGQVEAASRVATAEEGRTLALRENEARHFARTGVTEIKDREQKYARFSQPVALDAYFPEVRYVHWSFDEVTGNILRADTFGWPVQNRNARLQVPAETALDTLRTEGRWQRALRLDGQAFAKAPFPGLSGNSAHTVMFWVRIAPDAQLSDAYAMVAWGLHFKELGIHPVHICWNRNPLEGPIGAIRTDFLGGFAMGTTPLRDGRWHHIAVVFVPGADADSLAQVKQYVDGRLETSASTRGIRRDIAPDAGAPDATAIADTVWLGCRLGIDGERRGRFRGEMDELFIADWALGPTEIAYVMKENKLPYSHLAAVSPTP